MLRYLTKKSIKSFIKERIENFSKTKEVHFIQAGFQIVQDGLFVIHFDTNEGAGPDGSWTLELGENSLKKNVMEISFIRGSQSRKNWRTYKRNHA